MVTHVPYIDLNRQYRAHEDSYVEIFKQVAESGLWVMGPGVEKFERAVADYCGTRHAIGVANGTDGLILILKALDIGPGDEVIVPVNSFIATAGAVAACGASPVFADVQSDLNLCPNAALDKITAKTKAIMPVHLTGRPAEMEALQKICDDHHLHLIEDAAQAIGARFKGKRVGGLAKAAAFSLHPLKNMNVMGDGGFITTDDSDLFEQIKKLQNHGLVGRDHCAQWGLNSRLDSLQAEIARFHLTHLDDWTAKIRRHAERYQDGLKDVVKVPEDLDHQFNVYHTFIIYCDRRDGLMADLARHTIGTKIHYPILLHDQEAARDLGYHPGDFPVAEDLVTKMLTLPISPFMSSEEIDYVIHHIRGFYQNPQKTG